MPRAWGSAELGLREEGDSWVLGEKAPGGLGTRLPEGGGHCGSKFLVL